MAETEPKETGLFCFISPDRVCGADCMAYSDPPNHKDFVGKQWAHCLLLVNTHRAGKHLTVLASHADTLLNLKQDEARTNQPPPPKVR